MATGVNVKMGVSGVAQFKQGMKESQQAVKTLDQALKLNEQQLKLNGDAELYLQNKTKILEDQIKKQTEVVKQSQNALESMRKNGVNESSASFQQMQQQVYKATTDLLSMRQQLQNVGEDADGVSDYVDEMNNQLRSVGKNVSWQNVTEGIGKITDKLEAAGKAAWRMGKRIVEATLGGGQWADELATEAQKWEVSPEELYRMRQTANLIDTDAETILAARKKITTAMGKEGSKETMGAFAALGIDPMARHGDIEGVFWDAGNALMNMEDKVNRNEYAMQLFGRSFEDLIPLFSAGRENYEEMMNSWSWIGDDQLDNLLKLDDASQKLTTEWEAIKLQFESTMAQVMTPVMETLTELLKEFNTYLQSDEGQEMLESLGESVSALFEDIANIDPETVINGIKDAIDGVKNGLDWIKKNKDGIKKALEVIAGGFALLKLAGLASEIGRMVTGLRGLTGFGGGNGGTNGTQTTVPTGGTGGSNGGGLNFWDRLSGFMAAGSFYRATEGRLKEQQRELDRQMEGMTAQEQQDFMLINTLHWTPEMVRAYRLNEQLYNGKAANVDLYGAAHIESTGELIHKDRRGMKTFEDYELERNINRMTSVVETNTTDQTTASKNAADAVTDMTSTLPPAIEAAIRRGMSGITVIIDDRGVGAIGSKVSNLFGNALAAAIK